MIIFSDRIAKRNRPDQIIPIVSILLIWTNYFYIFNRSAGWCDTDHTGNLRIGPEGKKMVKSIFALVFSYLIGSFPTALIAGKLLKNIDIRKHGSGNAGATNVLRILGWKAALIVLLIDMLKGFAAVYWIARLIPQSESPDNFAIFQISVSYLCFLFSGTFNC